MNFGEDESLGLQYCRAIKEIPELFLTPIIFVTADLKPGTIIDGYRAGAVDYIVKPLKREELLNRVLAHLDLHERRAAETIRRKFQGQLLHLLSHELINPVSSGESLFTYLEEDQSLFPDYAPIIKESFKQTMELIEKSRQVVAITEDLSSISLEFFPLIDALNAIVEVFSEKLKAKGIEINVEIDHSIEIFVDWATFVKVVLYHLIHNSYKFTDKGGKILIEAELLDGTVKMSLSDTGIGIPDKMKNDLFNISISSKRKGTAGEEGEGFGLALVRNQLTYFMGEVEFSSIDIAKDPVNHGSKFQIFLKGRSKEPT